jgi:hypothetical protein
VLVLGGVLLARPIARVAPGSATTAPTAAPPAAPADPFSWAWAAFGQPELPVEPPGPEGRALLSVARGRADLLVPLELYLTEEGGLSLPGRQAAAIEYRGRDGRLTVFRWRTPASGAKGTPVRPGSAPPRATRWGRAGARWWSDGEVVSMVIGTLDPAQLREAADRVRRAERGWSGPAVTVP